jgi:hypothetical protein
LPIVEKTWKKNPLVPFSSVQPSSASAGLVESWNESEASLFVRIHKVITQLYEAEAENGIRIHEGIRNLEYFKMPQVLQSNQQHIAKT